MQRAHLQPTLQHFSRTPVVNLSQNVDKQSKVKQMWTIKSCKMNGALGQQLFTKAVGDMTLWPVRCCRQNIDIGLAQRVLHGHELHVFVERMKEAVAVKKMYCVNPYCSHFLDLDNLPEDHDSYPCPRCATLLCLACRGAAHRGMSCSEAKESRGTTEADMQLQELAERKGWRKCGKCGVMVQLASGCNHMACRCGHHCCYQCGTQWMDASGQQAQQCRCELWQEGNLLEEERRQVANVERVERRRVEEPERQMIRERLIAGAHTTLGSIGTMARIS
eukprot:s4426_g3.t2